MKAYAFIAMLALAACASHQEQSKEQVVQQQGEVKKEVAYGGHCGMGLCLKKKVKGDPKYSYEYKNKIYYFSSAEAKNKFIAKIDENIKKANHYWGDLSGLDKFR